MTKPYSPTGSSPSQLFRESAETSTSKATSTSTVPPFEQLSASSKIGGTLFCQGTPSSPTSSSGLSKRAKAGIGVGATLGVLLLLGITIAIFVVRRRRRQQGAIGPKTKQDQRDGKDEAGDRITDDEDTMKTMTATTIEMTRPTPTAPIIANTSGTPAERYPLRPKRLQQ